MFPDEMTFKVPFQPKPLYDTVRGAGKLERDPLSDSTVTGQGGSVLN